MMDLKKEFEKRILPIKDKLSEKDFEKLLLVAEGFAFELMRANLIARIINSGYNIRFWWQETSKNKFRIMWEIDNQLLDQHIDGDECGYNTAEEAMKSVIDTLREIEKQKEAQKRRIINPN